MAELVIQLQQQQQAALEQAAALPAQATYRFDTAAASQPVIQSYRRQVKSWQWGCFEAQTVVRSPAPATATAPPGAGLNLLVPKGGQYAFDLLAQVGLQSWLANQTLAQLQASLREHTPSLDIPQSSLYELSRHFLFFFGALHTQAIPTLREYFHQRGPCLWLIDGTLEPGTAEFFGVQEVPERILLACAKIPTENAVDVAACLRQTAQAFGPPDGLCRDLSHVLQAACQQALPGVPQHVCHSHLARDVGQDLYQAPQAALSRRLTALRLSTQWASQRCSQSEALRQQLQAHGTYSLLSQWLQGQPLPALWQQTWGRELLLALHVWIQDYAHDGQRQGFPFDPHLLYFHRRLLRVQQALAGLWQRPSFVRQAPPALANFYQSLQQYRDDPEIQAAAAHYEKAYAIFQSLRQALRLSTTEANPLHAAYALAASEEPALVQALQQLREQAQRHSQANPDAQTRHLYHIVAQHLETYGPFLEGVAGERTTNAIESRWNRSKRHRRQTHGRKKLTRDFVALPAEWMLVPNLEIPRYVELVLGGKLENLADKLAQAAPTAGSYSQWQACQRTQHWGRVPKRLLRQPNFLDQLLGLAGKVGRWFR